MEDFKTVEWRYEFGNLEPFIANIKIETQGWSRNGSKEKNIPNEGSALRWQKIRSKKGIHAITFQKKPWCFTNLT